MQWATVNGLSTRYELAGHGATAIIMVHEIGGSLESWDAVAPSLSRRYRTLRYDQRGAGLSEKVRRPFRLEDLVEDLAQLLAEVSVPPPYSLLGAAAGAALALLFAASYPAWVEKLVLCNPATSVDDQRRASLHERATLAEREGMRATLPFSLARSYPEEVIDNRETYELYQARFLANDPTCYALQNRALMALDFAQMLAYVRCPTLVLAGSHDLVRSPAAVAEFAQTLPGAQFELLAGGHLLPVQAPEAVLGSFARFFAIPSAHPRGKEEA